MELSNQSYKSPLFSLSLQQTDRSMYMMMKTHSTIINTRQLPDTKKILEHLCPRVLKTKCFNEQNLPFKEEVKQTEIGHMFEHLVLAYLCELYSEQGITNVTFNGQTCWNWNIDDRGTFHIYLTPLNVFPSLLKEAVHNSIMITEFIMKSRKLTKKTSSRMATRVV